MERIIKDFELTPEELQRTLWAFGLTAKSPTATVGGGRIATNLFVETAEIGGVIIRAYPHGYGQAKVRFEVDVLEHLSERGCPVPRPIRLVRERTHHQSIFSTPEIEICIYKALEGSTVSQAELSVQLACEAGKALANLIPHAASFIPSALIPQGDLGFISGLVRAAKERDELFASSPIAAEMELVVSDGELVRALQKSTCGIVHGDYFFENVLVKESRTEVSGILDFGDAYIGSIMNDIVIGAMEFAVLTDETWDLDCFDVFLRSHKSWLRREGLPATLAKKLLLANCIRFAVYTLPFSNAEGRPIEQNRYIARFTKIISTDLGHRLESIWSRNC